MVGQQQPLSTYFSQHFWVDHRNRFDAMLIAGQKPGPIDPTAQALNKPVGLGWIILIGTICKIQHYYTLKNSGHRVKPIPGILFCISAISNGAHQFTISYQNQFQTDCLINTISPDRQDRNTPLRIMLHAVSPRYSTLQISKLVLEQIPTTASPPKRIMITA